MTKEDMELLKKQYEESEFSSIIHDISGVYVPLDKTWKNIGISMSGGLDSALLTYILCTLIEQYNLDITVHIISHVRMWKLRPWQQYISKDVFDYLQKRFSNIKMERYEGFIPIGLEWKNNAATLVKNEYGVEEFGDVLMMRSYAEFIGHNKNFDAYYNALTKNPSGVKLTWALENRNLTTYDIINNFDYTIKKYNEKSVISRPFRFVEKDWIVGRYKEFGIMELFNLTRSCEGDKIQFPEIFGDLDYTNYLPGQDVPTCGKCFWCQEREWGLDNS